MRSFYPPTAVVFVDGWNPVPVAAATRLLGMVFRRAPYMEVPNLVFIEARPIPLTLLQMRKRGLRAHRGGNVKTACPPWL
ncbi:hypothetical protein [Dyella amyloliquefaciens]|uniref:hypothetical protein n=1 Tax=Dyella amyloliquefaciens TaxID=1770545 RepID=UPI00102E6666|nr:hypothetical protein [Dyella amyloliquefaciens]